jgi:hypothetical protein
MKLKRKFVFWLLFLATPIIAIAEEKDLRTQTDAQGETEIGFCARPSPDAFGFPGHAFVTFSEIPNGGARKFRAVGHTVSTAGIPATVFTYFGGRPVSGRQMEEIFSHLKQACLVLKVDRAVYDRAIAAARPTLSALGLPDELAATAESYSLTGNDCIDFALRVAQIVQSSGLNVPPRGPTDTPGAYIRKLINANP